MFGTFETGVLYKEVYFNYLKIIKDD